MALCLALCVGSSVAFSAPHVGEWSTQPRAACALVRMPALAGGRKVVRVQTASAPLWQSASWIPSRAGIQSYLDGGVSVFVSQGSR